MSDASQRIIESRIKNILKKCGLFTPEQTDIPGLVKNAALALPREFPGEPSLIAGMTIRDALCEFCGIVNVGPFGCMQTRMGDAVTIPLATVEGICRAKELIGEKPHFSGFALEDRVPFLSVESDGNPYPQLLEARFENFCLQAARTALKQGRKPAVRG